LNVKENKTLKNTNVYLDESSINQNSESILYCEKITTPQTIANVIERENLMIQDNSNLKLITSGPKEVYDSKTINQSLIHKNEKTFNEQKELNCERTNLLPKEPENETLPINTSVKQIPVGTATEVKSMASDRPEIKTLPVYDREEQISSENDSVFKGKVSSRKEISQMTSQNLLNDLPGKGRKIILVGIVDGEPVTSILDSVKISGEFTSHLYL
jgi:hypothetical protein